MRNSNFTEIDWIVATYGLGQPIIEVAPSVTANTFTRELGHKQYEMSNHFGNYASLYASPKRCFRDSHPVRNETGVLVVVSDVKTIIHDGEVITGYAAQVISAADYSPFGVVLEGRTFSSETYRFGFNGKEKDDEGMGGGGQTYDYGFRIYNPGLAKFLSVDPLSASYPWYTPYQFAGNMPIWAIDLDGLEESKVTGNFETLVLNFKASFVTAWKDSFSTNKKGKETSTEYGALLIKVTTKDAVGNIVSTSYEMLNYHGNSSDSWEADYTGFNAETMEIIGNFHTHPYTKEEQKKEQRLLPNFDGNGVTFSSSDLSSYASDIKKGKLTKGDVVFVVAGDVIYGLEITDTDLAQKILSNQDLLMELDWHTDDNQPTSEAPGEMPDYGETSWAKFVEIVNSFGTPAELGITLHKENIETAKSSDDGK